MDSSSPYMYLRGLELITPLISTKTVHSSSKLRVDLPRIFFKGFSQVVPRILPTNRALFDNKILCNLLVCKVSPNFLCSGYFSYVLRWRSESLGVVRSDGSQLSTSTSEPSESKEEWFNTKCSGKFQMYTSDGCAREEGNIDFLWFFNFVFWILSFDIQQSGKVEAYNV